MLQARMRFIVVFLIVAAAGWLAWPRTAVSARPVIPGPLNYFEDFESDPAGSYPANWYNVFSGLSGLISDLQAHQGVHSFRIESYPNWSRWDCWLLPEVPDLTIYRGAVMVETAGRGGALGFGFVRPGVPNEGRWANVVQFGNDGSIYFSSYAGGLVAIGSWSPGVWYVVEVRIDYTTQRAVVFIDGTLVGHNLVCDPKVLPASLFGSPVTLDQFGTLGDNFDGEGTGVIYLDTVSLGDLLVPVRAGTWGAVKALYKR